MVILDEVDIDYNDVSKNIDGEGELQDSLDSNGAYTPLKHANKILGEKIQGERIRRERKLNLPINGCMPSIDINNGASPLDIKTQNTSPPMIVLSNRLRKVNPLRSAGKILTL